MLGVPGNDTAFFTDLFSIVLIDLLLAGDNAVVIAMAVRALPRAQRWKGIVYGAGAAVVLRVVLTFFVAQILTLPYVKLVGGIVILWIAVKLFIEDEEATAAHREAGSLWHAVRIIVIADVTMALDNMLAVGAASHGNFFLLLFGLGLSIPFIVFTSGLLARLMERFPLIILVGAALLGKIGGEMIVTDPVLARFVPQTAVIIHGAELFLAVAVIVAGRVLLARAARNREA